MMDHSFLKGTRVSSLQATNKKIYFIQNLRFYPPERQVSRLHRYSGRLIKAERKGNKGNDPGYFLAMMLSWSFALANHFSLDLEEEIWKRYPYRCPYCTHCACSCKSERASERRVLLDVHKNKPETLYGFQRMFAKIYPHNTLSDAIKHLAEEISEIDEAVEHFTGEHKTHLLNEIILELVDVFANMCAVATCFEVDLAAEMEKYFSDGCFACHLTPCNCGYTANKAGSHS